MEHRNRKNYEPPFIPGKTGLFLSGDWGTSSLRVRLVDTTTGQVLGEEHSGNGIRQTWIAWEQAKETRSAGREQRLAQDTADEARSERIAFYLDVLRGSLLKLEERLGLSLQGIPLVLSGMASSSVGILELPYRELPFNLHSDGLIMEWLPAGDDFGNPVLLISGLRSGDDVMRGEETQLMGCLPGEGALQGEPGAEVLAGGADGNEGIAGADGNEGIAGADGLYIFPGTHSKHILVKDGIISAFTTYMTGEIFELLSEKSLLKGSVEKSPEPPGAHHWDSFRKGVEAASAGNLLHTAFQVRINELFQRLSKGDNFYFLSGLLIGAELWSLSGCDASTVYLCCGQALKDHYEKALEATAICKRVHIFPAGWVDKAAIRGQWAILSGIKPV